MAGEGEWGSVMEEWLLGVGDLAREVGKGMGSCVFSGLLCLGDGIRYGLLLLSCEMEDLVWGNDGRTIWSKY